MPAAPEGSFESEMVSFQNFLSTWDVWRGVRLSRSPVNASDPCSVACAWDRRGSTLVGCCLQSKTSSCP